MHEQSWPLKKVLLGLSRPFLKRIDEIASAEHRTRSDLAREALRQYVERFDRKQASMGRLIADNQPFAVR